jgi:drug/metabolite transporter (DMT)-like permease
MMGISAPILGVLFGLTSAAAWGAGDFSGGYAARRIPAMLVLGLSASAGFAIFLIIALLSGERQLTPADVFWASIGGVLGGMGLVLLYRGLAMGNAALVSPTAGVVGAGVPVVVGAFLEGLPSTLQMAGFLAGMAGIWLAARTSGGEKGGNRQGLILAILAGLNFGGFFVCLAQVQPGLVYSPMAITKAIQILMVLVIMWLNRLRLASPQGVPVALASGVLDAGGNTFYMLAVNVTRMDVAAVLSSMYPAGTVLLSILIFKEKVTPSQWLGVGLCIAAAALIAL